VKAPDSIAPLQTFEAKGAVMFVDEVRPLLALTSACHLPALTRELSPETYIEP
jgi:hypothetical protein